MSLVLNLRYSNSVGAASLSLINDVISTTVGAVPRVCPDSAYMKSRSYELNLHT